MKLKIFPIYIVDFRVKVNNTHRHCPEVENLMEGKMPFVTRYGITLVVLVILFITVILFLLKGTPSRLVEEIIEYTFGLSNTLKAR